MVRIIAVVGRKDGIGKSSIAVHLAGELSSRGQGLALIDADPQGSATRWGGPGHFNFAICPMPVMVDKLPEWVKRVRRIEADTIIIDCPPHLDAALQATMGMVDLAILPCGPSSLDILAMGEVLDVLKAARQRRADDKPLAMIVPNRVDRWTSEGRKIINELAKLGEPLGPSIAYRSAFVRAFDTGDTVGAIVRGTQADSQIKELADALDARS